MKNSFPVAETINLLGRINEEGGLLVPNEVLRDFCRKHPKSRVLLKITALSKDQTAAQRGYYWGYIIPECRKALAEKGTLFTDAQADELLRSQCPICWNEGELQTVADFDAEDMASFIEWVKQFAAENLSVFIDDPYNL